MLLVSAIGFRFLVDRHGEKGLAVVTTSTLSSSTSMGRVIELNPAKFGFFTESTEHAADGPALRELLKRDGYVFLRDVLDKEILLNVQRIVADELYRLDAIDPDGDFAAHQFPARPGLSLYKVVADISQAERQALTRQPALNSIFEAIFDEEVKPLDYSWPRVASPGCCEAPHSDWVYMRRGTDRLYAAWIPLMDLPLSQGPLMILENSHHKNPHTRRYLQLDSDKLGYFDGAHFKHGTLVHGGRYSRRPDRVSAQFGSRWLSADYRLGDVVIFSTRGLHATLDNRSKGFRLSIDVRYQPVAEKADPRFNGPKPAAHSAVGANVFSHAQQVTAKVRQLVDKRRRPVR